MARITVEDCLNELNNRFELVLLATKRARQLAMTNADPYLPVENDKTTVLALREIAAGLVDENNIDPKESAEDNPADLMQQAVNQENKLDGQQPQADGSIPPIFQSQARNTGTTLSTAPSSPFISSAGAQPRSQTTSSPFISNAGAVPGGATQSPFVSSGSASPASGSSSPFISTSNATNTDSASSKPKSPFMVPVTPGSQGVTTLSTAFQQKQNPSDASASGQEDSAADAFEKREQKSKEDEDPTSEG